MVSLTRWCYSFSVLVQQKRGPTGGKESHSQQAYAGTPKRKKTAVQSAWLCLVHWLFQGCLAKQLVASWSSFRSVALWLAGMGGLSVRLEAYISVYKRTRRQLHRIRMGRSKDLRQGGQRKQEQVLCIVPLSGAHHASGLAY